MAYNRVTRQREWQWGTWAAFAGIVALRGLLWLFGRNRATAPGWKLGLTGIYTIGALVALGYALRKWRLERKDVLEDGELD